MTKESTSALTPIDFLRASKLIHIAISSTVETANPYEHRAHRECEFCLIQDGSCTMNIAGHDVAAKEGDFIFILPYISHAITADNSASCTIFHLHFNLNFLNNPLYQMFSILKTDLYEYFFLYIQNYLHGESDFQLETCLQNIISERNRQHTEVTMLNFYLLELVLLLSKRIQNDYPVSVNFHTPYVVKTIDYIRSHYSKKLTLALLAEQSQISSRYLSKLFYECTHTTVLDYINFYRVNQSVFLIAENQPFTSIALNVGFSSPPHYTKTFKKYMGVSPKDYRNSLFM